MERQDTPNPGSDEARKQGCTCPVVDNHFGRGTPYKDDDVFYVWPTCPLHGSAGKPPAN